MFGTSSKEPVHDDLELVITSLRQEVAELRDDARYQARVVNLAQKEIDLEHRKEIQDLNVQLADAKAEKAWQIESAKNSIRVALEKDCFESDLARVEAEARLETFKEMDRADDREASKANLATLIEGIIEAAKKEAPAPVVNVLCPHSTKEHHDSKSLG